MSQVEITGIDLVLRKLKRLGDPRTIHDSFIQESAQILGREVRNVLPVSEKMKVRTLKDGIRGTVRFGLFRGFALAGLSLGFKRYRSRLLALVREM